MNWCQVSLERLSKHVVRHGMNVPWHFWIRNGGGLMSTSWPRTVVFSWAAPDTRRRNLAGAFFPTEVPRASWSCQACGYPEENVHVHTVPAIRAPVRRHTTGPCLGPTAAPLTCSLVRSGFWRWGTWIPEQQTRGSRTFPHLAPWILPQKHFKCLLQFGMGAVSQTSNAAHYLADVCAASFPDAAWGTTNT